MKVNITWEQLAKALHLGYEGPDEFFVMDQASDEARQWIKEYTANNGIDSISEEAKDQVLFAIEESLSNHWSLANVLSKNLDLSGLVDSVNIWSERGPQMAGIYERELPSGKGIIDWGTGSDGVWFKLARPFLVAYIEAAYCVSSFGDEGLNLKDMEGWSVAATMHRIAECEGSEIRLDLDRWDDRRHGPSYWDLEKIVKNANK